MIFRTEHSCLLRHTRQSFIARPRRGLLCICALTSCGGGIGLKKPFVGGPVSERLIAEGVLAHRMWTPPFCRMRWAFLVSARHYAHATNACASRRIVRAVIEMIVSLAERRPCNEM